MCSGAPGGIRTPDQSVRSRLLYPAELQAQYSEWLAGGIYASDVEMPIAIYFFFEMKDYIEDFQLIC